MLACYFRPVIARPLRLDAAQYAALTFASFRLAQGNERHHRLIYRGIFKAFGELELPTSGHIKASIELIERFTKGHRSRVVDKNHRVDQVGKEVRAMHRVFLEEARNRTSNFRIIEVGLCVIDQDYYYLIQRGKRPFRAKNNLPESEKEKIEAYRHQSLFVNYGVLARSTGSSILDFVLAEACADFRALKERTTQNETVKKYQRILDHHKKHFPELEIPEIWLP